MCMGGSGEGSEAFSRSSMLCFHCSSTVAAAFVLARARALATEWRVILRGRGAGRTLWGARARPRLPPRLLWRGFAASTPGHVDGVLRHAQLAVVLFGNVCLGHPHAHSVLPHLARLAADHEPTGVVIVAAHAACHPVVTHGWATSFFVCRALAPVGVVLLAATPPFPV